MAKGIIYVMSTVVDGLVKIGKTTDFESRMAILESNGYRNVTGLKRQFAIEVDNYDEVELLLDDLFAKSRVGNTELFSLDINKVIQLLSAFDGKQVYPTTETKEEVFENATEAVQNQLLPDGEYFLSVKIKGTDKYAKGTMKVNNGKLVVLTGAILGPLTDISVSSWLSIRNSLIIENDVTATSFEVKSPSMAAAILTGHNINGWNCWKNKEGKTINIYRKTKNTEE